MDYIINFWDMTEYGLILQDGNSILSIAEGGETLTHEIFTVTDDGFYNDGVSDTIPAPWPGSAIVLLSKENDDSHASLLIDAKNKFLRIGEWQMFWHDTCLTGHRGTLLRMYNASAYGRAFTDLLPEDGMDGVQAAPWDSYWGANAEEKAVF